MSSLPLSTEQLVDELDQLLLDVAELEGIQTEYYQGGLRQNEVQDDPYFYNNEQQSEYEEGIVPSGVSSYYIKDYNYSVSAEFECMSNCITNCISDMPDLAARQTEEDFKESTEYLYQIINCIGDPIFVIDRQHRLALVNDAYCTFMCARRKDLLGKTGPDFIPQDHVMSFWEQEETVFETGHDCVTEDNLTNGRGEARIVMTRKSLLQNENGGKQIVGVIRDITEYKRLEARFLHAQKMEAVGVLAGGVAHDFNNMLTVIRCYTDAMKQGLLPNDQRRRDLEQIEKAGQQAASLTSQLMAFSRKQILFPRMINLNDILADMGAMLCRLIGEDIEQITVAQPELRTIHADPAQIQQIVMNLAINSRDAMPQGGKLIIETANVDFDETYIKAHPIVAAGSYVMLAISDNGIGMDENTKARIFEPFFTTKGPGKGTGLGLSTVYGIVKQSNGYIWVYSELGQGATFKMYFPSLNSTASKPEGESILEVGFKGSETILLAEDEPSVRVLAGRILRMRGYTVIEASNGSEALRLAQEFPSEIHLIVTDIVMPGLSGKALVSLLETTRPGIRALYMSGYTDTAVHQGILDSTIAFLQKPFNSDALARKVFETLNS